MKTKPTVILLKGNGPISINNELMELITITTSHGFIGFPLKQLRAQKVVTLTDYDRFLIIEKEITEKPCCFVFSYDILENKDLELIKAEELEILE
ncbi:hypothetical protein CKA55_01960 [Arcobacter suis]|uniref:Uncharacterized protein n=1 Tax=Arcobacter suis CECT 7833 TaxID=663365 RepID=A0AAD0SNI8_9BACT|nr:hypothetical protein [Arcobacter suis]AXX88571.1 hypothetical protein ASUIS_0053 [Arcobacter suis CECT 7833]RWS47595.1 hypothetical protein CKA55_01960 [Arcobacter suis]